MAPQRSWLRASLGKLQRCSCCWPQKPTLARLTIKATQLSGMRFSTMATTVHRPNYWPLLSPLMVAVVLQRLQDINAMLRAGADPKCTVQLPSGIHSAHSLAQNDPPRTWFGQICPNVVNLVESSLRWSEKSHYLFPPGFRRGVRHVCGLKIALDRVDHRFSNSVWMIIIAYLPRNWVF